MITVTNEYRLLPRFTEVGFEVVDTPEHVRDLLYRTVQHEIDSNWDHIPLENLIDVVYTPIRSKFVDMRGVDREVMNELTTFHEEWAGGMKLKPTSAYGVRLYQNGSSLAFHYDKTHTHVISSIIHITHKYDNDDEPWPIEIEDHNGVMHAVNLEPGQMLFYESAVCLHGRRKTLKGQYYGSLFVHYQPIDVHIWNYTIEDVVEHVPLHWRNGVVETRGSRWSGASLTIDSLVTDGANKRIIDGEEITNISAYYDMLAEKGEIRDISSYYVNDDVTADEL